MKRFLTDVDFDKNIFRPVDVAIIDGYSVGDRLLDGVKFEVRIVDDEFVVNVCPRFESYFDKLNTKMWLEKIAEYCHTVDVFESNGEYEVVWYDDALPLDQHPARFLGKPIIVE